MTTGEKGSEAAGMKGSTEAAADAPKPVPALNGSIEPKKERRNQCENAPYDSILKRRLKSLFCDMESQHHIVRPPKL